MGNNSGIDHTVINNRERAVSTDINRLQQQGAKALADLLSRWVNDVYVDDLAGGEESWNVGVAGIQAQDSTPLSADVYGGLKVRPFSNHLLVSTGTLGAKATPGTPDAGKDSDYVIVNDPGVTDANVLTFVTNGAGSKRVDVVECEIFESVLTTENRDIYDPVTGLFTASLVTKSAGARLTFRIREGTAGAGYPGHASGWLPLAIAIHEIASATFSDVEFYDVRPLVQMRSKQPTDRRYSPADTGNDNYKQGVADAGGGTFYIGGTFDIGNPVRDVTVVRGYEMRGVITPTLPGDATNTEDDRSRLEIKAEYFANGISATPANRFLYLVSVQPFGLPLWRRYTRENAQSGEREPGPNCGLYVLVDSTLIMGDRGHTLAVVPMPVGYGLPNASSPGRFVGLIHETGASYRPSFMNEQMWWGGTITIIGAPAAGSTTQVVDYDLSFRGGSANILPGYCSGFQAQVFVEADLGGGSEIMVNSRLLIQAQANGIGGTNLGQLHRTVVPTGITGPQTFLNWNMNLFFALPAEDVPNTEGVAAKGNVLGPINVNAEAGFADGGTFSNGAGSLFISGFRMGY